MNTAMPDALAGDSDGFRIDIAADDAARSKQRRGGRRMPEPVPTSTTESPGAHILFDGLERQLGGRVTAGPTGHARIDGEAQAARWRSVSRHQGGARKNRCPTGSGGQASRVACAQSTVSSSRSSGAWKASNRPGGRAEVLEERSNPAILFDNSRGAALPEFG